ncbi:MAG TPA: ParB/RepB/Spo0J family partition protein [Gemmatimonadales bacterium]|nr:ParB/RepB/Spo0J family partition protein [Gemmatimonadales bacterium]
MSDTRRLGRGLEALLGPVTREAAQASGALRELPVSAVRPNPFQPRTTFDEQELQDLANSIGASGLLQPIVVRPKDAGYELIAGERRWRAVQRLGWTNVPAVIKEADDRTLLTLALIENLQRDNLSPIDEAVGYQRLMDEFQVAQTEVARLVGRDRSTVSNMLRLLKLPDAVRALVHSGRLSEGHGRALLGLNNPAAIEKLAHDAAAGGWSVREVEERVRGDAPATRRPRATKAAAEPTAQSADARRIEDALRRRLGTDVRLTAKRRGRGNLVISYYSNDDLARVLELILGTPFDG